MEIVLTKLQLDKIVRLLEASSAIQTKINSLEEQIAQQKMNLEERRKNQNDIIETILECNGVDLSKVTELNLTSNILKVELINESTIPFSESEPIEPVDEIQPTEPVENN